ncbi:hypothetical protein HYV82_00075 [Candidatus Woesearchaeota archaeon]|nr:hypothetical protein [Candidatus Woesearchaeota archaeon]
MDESKGGNISDIEVEDSEAAAAASHDKAAEHALTRAERRKLKRQDAKEEMKAESQKNARKSLTGKIIIAAIGIALTGLIWLLISSSGAKAKSLDSFAGCLSEKGAVIYGNEWCSYTQRQKNMFGSSFSRIKYVICDQQKKLCDEKQITITPTWEINGSMYREVQKLEALSHLSGCKL